MSLFSNGLKSTRDKHSLPAASATPTHNMNIEHLSLPFPIPI